MKKLITLTAIVLLAGIAGFAQKPVGIDSTFGKNGYAMHIPSVNGSHYGGICLGNNDTVFLTGYTDGSDENLFIIKKDSKGQNVGSFGTNSQVTLDPLLGADDRGKSIYQLPDGKLLVCGSMTGMNDLDIFLSRHNEDGTIDATFSNNGMSHFNMIGNDGVVKMIVSNGKVYIGTHSTVNSKYTDAYIIRMNMDGTLDQTFGTMGFVTIDPNNGDMETLYDFEVAKDGSIVVVGRTQTQAFVTKMYMCKITKSGKIDLTFGNNGYYMHTEAGFTRLNCVKLAPDNSIFWGGYHEVNSYDAALMLKIDSDGKLNSTFGSGNGKVSLNMAAQSDQGIEAIHVLNDGRVFVAGAVRTMGIGTHGFTAIFEKNGNASTNYHGTGFYVAPLPDSAAEFGFEHIVMQADSQLLLSGVYIDSAFKYGVFVARIKNEPPPVNSVKNIAGASYNANVYPNPSTGIFSIQADGNQVVKMVNMYDVTGRQVANWHHAQDSYSIPAHIPGGLYYISISFEGRIENRKLILNR